MNPRLPIFLLLLTALAPLRARAQDAAAAPGLDKNSLQIIARKNIFDPTRTGGRSGRKAPRVESFTFCGGAFEGSLAAAFFSGNGAPAKPLLPGDTINGFKVDAVTFNSVTLKAADGPAQTLAMGTSMRREENGPWKPSEEPAPADTSATPGSSDMAAPAASSANDSDIIKRLKARREDN